jgi:hypothetical protein
MAIVKADAYGHGAVQVARLLEGKCAFFGVSSMLEALELRQAGLTTPILILGQTPISAFPLAIEMGIRPTIFHFEAALALSKASETALGTVNAVTGVTMLLGSILASALPAPKSRVKAIWCCLMLSMCTENFFLAFGNSIWVWCLGAFLGWISLPWMSANLEAVNRLNIPLEIQGRVFAARNSFQFFTIPLGYFLGGILVDEVFEPIMATQAAGSLPVRLFGSGKGSGAAFLFAVLWLMGIAVCMLFRGDRYIRKLEQ